MGLTWETFVTSPGAGGLAAFLAALIVGASALRVSQHRKKAERYSIIELRAARRATMRSSSRAQAALDKHNAEQRWWTRFTWLVTADDLTINTRITILEHMTSEADDLDSPELVRVAQAWTRDLYQRL